MKIKDLITVLLTTVLLTSCLPSGNFIIYAEGSPDESSVNLHLYDLNSRDNKQITNLEDATYPSWSPDGRKFVFSSKDGLYYINNQTPTKLIKIIDTPNIESRPSWSPNGKKIAFLSQSVDNSSLYDLMSVNTDGTGLVTLASNLAAESDYDLGESHYYFSFSWSPNGQKLAFSFPVGNSREIFTINADGTNRKQITHLSTLLPEYTPPTQPAWSPDGKRIAFVTWDLYVINSDGTGLKKLIDMNSGGYAAFSNPLWSPNGEYIACEDLGSRLYVVKPDGTDVTYLSDWLYIGSESWSPDGYKIAYMVFVSGSLDIYITDVRTIQTIEIVKSVGFGRDLSLAWQP